MSSKLKGTCVFPSPPMLTLTDCSSGTFMSSCDCSISLKQASVDRGASDQAWDAATRVPGRLVLQEQARRKGSY